VSLSRKAVTGVLALAALVGGLVLFGAYLTGGPLGGALAPNTAPPSGGPARSVPAKQSTRDPETGLRWAELSALPVEARRVVATIDRGGPFRYAQDGATFGNRERLLPSRPAGFYREYTVDTPGSQDRGARRVITGDAGRMLFYTADHYNTFVRVRR
jgi:ribonuclease T1